MTPREPCVFTPKFSPKSLLPTSSSCNETHCKMEDKSPASEREGSNTNIQTKCLNGQQPGLDEDIIGDAISQLEINGDTKMSFSSSQACGTSQHSVQAIYQGQQNKKQIWRQVQPAHEVHDQEQRTEIGDISETEWRQEEREGQHDQQIRGEPQACLFVASLAASRTDIQLVESVTEHFKKWGPLLNVKVLKDWMQRPYSFVQFEHVEHAQKAMLEAQNTIIDGRHIRIEQARVNRTLFVLRFRRTMTEQDLISVLEQYGPVEDVSIFHDLGSLSNRRYAFAKFAYRDDAIRAYMSLRSNSKWTVEWAPNLSCQNQIEKESVFIGQLNPDLVTETALRERFQVYGNIQHIHLVKRNRPGTNKPTAFAFIEFDDENSAKEAIEGENETTFLRTTIRVQHREASEYRIQRQNAAIQAARSLNIPRLVGPPPIGMLNQHLNTAEYCGSCQPYQSSGVGGSMYSTTYYAYPPSGMPMTGMGFIPVPQLGAVYLQQGGSPQGSIMNHDFSQGYYQGFTAYNGQPKNAGTEHESGQETAQADHENGYVQPPEGLFYSQAIPAQVYLYDQNPCAASLSPNMQLASAPFHPMWLGLPRPRCNSPKRSSTESASQQLFYTPSSHGRQPESISS